MEFIALQFIQTARLLTVAYEKHRHSISHFLKALSQLVVDNCYLHEKAISRG